ncbi:hypothetical protein GMOD_00005411 [Pyrenophora seminiperda CCB06]|uniref:Uncharacterized protein n=1 Tax=Pyrenophora seminiperda CCB06 TaxID=1302712 RepID=A0A3M7LVQ9_9PLEO|nr:hypothetical protein GMOD_00005411 [Pyrenophora seminiperda CCB06]
MFRHLWVYSQEHKSIYHRQ